MKAFKNQYDVCNLLWEYGFELTHYDEDDNAHLSKVCGASSDPICVNCDGLVQGVDFFDFVYSRNKERENKTYYYDNEK